MNQEILEYIKSQRVGVLALEMLDGSPHAATVHFTIVESPIFFIFETSAKSRKAEPILKNQITRASLVIGSDERNMKTLQFDGHVELLKADDPSIDTYLDEFPEKKLKVQKSQDIIFFKFIFSWWRYTDWTKPEGKLILSS